MKLRITTLSLLLIMLVGAFAMIPMLPVNSMISQEVSLDTIPEDLQEQVAATLAEDGLIYPSDFDLDSLLGDRVNEYKTIYEPWKSKAAIHCIRYDEATGFLACGGGYLYDNEVHLFRLNQETNQFDKVYELGDGVIRGDVLSVDFGDTDLNDFIEVVVGSADGHVYVYEQRHLYDPYANSENAFDLVWTSPGFFRVFDVEVADVDHDYRPDIIVGAWDGYVHLFEFTNHSSYPFEEAHWIEYTEVSTLEVGEKVYSLETGDTNNNGLDEIIVGTREGTVFVFENAGISLTINGQPFPLVRDNRYYLNWTSLNYTWEPILSMAIGELDGDAGDEIALVAEGQGVFTLDWNSASKTYDYQKVIRDYQAWETFGFHGLDYWVDKVVSCENVTYHDPINASLVIDEPIEYAWSESQGFFLPNASVYPFNSGMAQATDGNYSTFDAASSVVDAAYAVVDFGNDEEGTGGANAGVDIIITFKDPIDLDLFTKFNFSIGQSATDLVQVSSERMWKNPVDSHELLVDVDDVMSEKEWDWFRYAELMVFNDGNYSINSLELMQVNNLLTDVLSLTIGPFDLDGDSYWTGEPELDKIVAGTSVGEFIAIGYDAGEYDVLWESYDNDRYTLGAYVWDIEYISTLPNVANYIEIFKLDFDPGPALTVNAWSYGVPAPLIPDPDFNGVYEGGDGEPVYLLGTDGYHTVVLDMNGEYSSLMIGGVDADIIKPYSAAEMAWLWPEMGWYPSIISTTFNPSAPYVAESLLHGRATMDFYSRLGPTDPYTKVGSIQSFDATGQITQLLYSSKTTPRLTFQDYDDDGDLDMIISNGYVYMCRNLLEEEAEPTFMLEPGYLAPINEETGSIVWGQPEWFDIDADGDLDLILSYATKYGVTVFLNKGTNVNPVWEEDKLLLKNANPLTAMTTLEYNNVRMIPNTGGSTLQNYAEAADFDLQGDYHLGAYDLSAEQLVLAMATYDSMESYMVATYPLVSRMEFCLKYSAAFKNIGFHIHESWNTDFDLDEWTLSIASGDLDEDGRGEIIVGDFDNNVYAFEHLTNNTYKRMFRSFDLNHTVISDESPYAYEQLQGISGDFYRHIFDHATHMVAGTDLDQDGHLELVVISSLQVYFFEATGVDDMLTLAYTFDLRDLGYMDVEFDIWESLDAVSAVAAGSDLDSDGRKELILAAGGFLFIYNVDEGSFNGMEDTDFFSESSDSSGRYYLIGNPKAAGYLENSYVDALAYGDTDQDGHQEVILGGTTDTSLLKSDGFTYIYECRGGTFYNAWNTSVERTHWNPVTSIIVDDQDYDGLNEIIIGHSFGVDIYEWIPNTDSQYQLMETITSSPNYPEISTDSVINPSYESFSLSNRSVSDMVWSLDGSLALYVYSSGGVLMYRGYDPDYDDFDHPIPFGAQIYSGTEYGGGSAIEFEMEPSLIATAEGYYMTWRTQRLDGQTDLWVSLYNFSKTPVADWEDPVTFYSDTVAGIECPKIFELNSTHIGIMYKQGFFAGNDQLRYHILEKSLTGGWSSWSISHHVDFPRYTDYDIHSGSIIKLDNGEFALAFSARDTAYGKSDYDIWCIVANESLYFQDILLRQATTSFYDEFYPDVEYLRTDNLTLLIAYENIGVSFDDRLGIVASTDNGTTWSNQQNLNPYPSYLTRIDYSGGYFNYYNTTTRMFRPEVYAPSILGLYNGGFLYTAAFTSVDQSFTDVHDIIFGIERSTDWTEIHLDDVDHMTTGDTDSDGRQEVIIASGNRFAVYELRHSIDSLGQMVYSEAYLSKTFDTEITGITTYDSNMNGWQEIAVSCRYGNVYVMEYRDPSAGATPFGVSHQISEIVTYGMAYPYGVKSLDIDDDGKDELILAPGAGGFHLIDDDGTVLYNESYDVFLLGSALVDLDGDGTPELVSEDGNDNMIAIDLSDGSIRWNYSSFSDNLEGFATGDIDGDGTVEVVAGTTDGRIWTLNHTGVLWHVEDVDPGDVWCIAVGDFNEDPLLGVAYGNDTYAVKVINPINGTVYYETPNGMVLGSSPQAMEAHDMNADGYDDVIFGNTVVRIADVMAGKLIYNSTIIGRQRGFIIEDFDGDNTDELFVLTKESGAYLIEAGTLRQQWHYQADLGEFQYSVPGYLGGTGNMDILLSANNSLAIALDGKSGLPMWMNSTGQWAQGLVTADFDGDGIDSGFIWYWPTTIYSYLREFQGVIPEEPEWEPGFPAHTAYWKVQSNYSTFEDVWTYDIDSDNWAEVFVKSNDEYLSMWSSRYGTMEWNVSMGGEIYDVFFGDLDGLGSIDGAVIIDRDTVRLVNLETTDKLGEISAPPGYRIPEGAIANFRNGIGFEYDEIAILYESVVNVKSYVAWYDGTGAWKYTNSVNSTNGEAHMAIGQFSGASTYDVAMGSKEGTVRFFNGTDGALDWSYFIGFYVEDIVFGDFTGAKGYHGVAVEYSNHIVLLDTNTQSPAVTVNFTYGYLREYYCADLDGDSLDDVILHLRTEGIRAYDRFGAEVWTFDAPLRYTVNDPYIGIFVEDIDFDGVPDVVLTNYEYIAVIDGATADLMWHYISEGRILAAAASICPFKFEERYNIAVVDGYSLAIASFYATPPSVPTPPAMVSPMLSALVDVLVSGSMMVLPLFVVAVVLSKHVKKEE